jgi:biopolymer transport protein ExbD
MMHSRRRSRKRVEPQGDLMLAAMVDMMVNVLLFLLTLYGAGPSTLVGELDLPEATSKDDTTAEVELAVTEDVVAIDGVVVLSLDRANGWSQLPHTDLFSVREKLRLRRQDFQEVPRLAVSIDRRVPWSVVKPLLAVAGDQGFTDLRFVVTSVTKH